MSLVKTVVFSLTKQLLPLPGLQSLQNSVGKAEMAYKQFCILLDITIFSTAIYHHQPY